MQKPTFQSIRQPKLSDAIERELETLILEGVLSAGQQLPPERELAKQFDVSRPSVREAIQRLEAKGLLTRRQGGGTFVSETLSSHFSDPLLNLLANHKDTQRDLLETRHALEGIAAFFAAVRGTKEDFEHISLCLQAVSQASSSRSRDEESKAVLKFLEAIAEASHNAVLLHIVRSLSPLLEKNVSQNLGLLYEREDAMQKLNEHRKNLMQAIISGEPEQAREMSHTHLVFIEETLLELTREQDRIARSLRRIQQTKQ